MGLVTRAGPRAAYPGGSGHVREAAPDFWSWNRTGTREGSLERATCSHHRPLGRQWATPTANGRRRDRTGHSQQIPLSKVQAESGRLLLAQTNSNTHPNRPLPYPERAPLAGTGPRVGMNEGT